jgi:hypothetical protein
MTRVRITFWALVTAAVLALGILTRALDAAPSPATGLTVAVAGVVATVAAGLALRIAVVLARHGDPD